MAGSKHGVSIAGMNLSCSFNARKLNLHLGENNVPKLLNVRTKDNVSESLSAGNHSPVDQSRSCTWFAPARATLKSTSQHIVCRVP